MPSTKAEVGFDDLATLEQALVAYFGKAGLPTDGGHSSRWVRFEVAGIPLGIPNFGARRRTVRYHDVHHLLTGYPTTWTGEAQISAWEIAAGCGRHWVAWMFNLSMLGVACAFAPRATFRAWCRGCRSRSCYAEEFESLLKQTIAALRARLGLHQQARPATVSERLSFALWVGLGLVLDLAPVLGIVAIIAWLW